MDTQQALNQQLEVLYSTESRRVLATLIRLLGDFDQAEEALHEAFRAALEQWPTQGVPANPRAWLVSAGRFKAIDGLRRNARFESLGEHDPVADDSSAQEEISSVEDDRLRLIFTCCHPALSDDAQVALTLREICDLSSEDIAKAFLSTPSTIAQRIVRAKAKIRDAGIPYEVPARSELPQRLAVVLRVIYLVFNEGYFASSGGSVIRSQLSTEAIRLGRLLHELLPEPPVKGLLALMLLHESRRPARVSADGQAVLLEEQDRSLWSPAHIAEGQALVLQSLQQGGYDGYNLQAAIAAVHAEAATASDTDWLQIVGLYDVLLRLQPSPVIELNRAVAVSMCNGPAAGLELIDGLLGRGELARYHLAQMAKADCLRRLGDRVAAREAYSNALELAGTSPDRVMIERRLSELQD
ncbi:RNA polymerase sigma factor [Pseudomonas sp. NPDC078700]|uniref:RNA polymerase sigma factor n=1 Tax=Pseudomonas sp. NPDC078700 TaxID=3364424 RepID=UPI0037CBF1E3